MTRRRQFNDRKLIKVYLDAADHQRITEAAQASGLPVSEWIRNRCLTHVVSVEFLTQVPKSGVDYCPHKKRRGDLCYKCDPKFGVPQLT